MHRFDSSTWFGLFGPNNLPDSIVKKLNTEVNKLLADKSVQDAILAQGAEPKAMSVADFDDFFRTDLKDSKVMVEVSGAKIQ